jgi:hypothetical protein
MNSVKRERTVFFLFRDFDLNPAELEIHRWLRSLGVKDEDVSIIDYHFHLKQVVVKFASQEIFDSFLLKHSIEAIFERNGLRYSIPLEIAGSTRRTVKIKFVPDEMNTGIIQAALEQYGMVGKIEREFPEVRNPDMLNAKRERLLVDMNLNKNIPSFITVMGMKLSVSYFGQIKTCSKCDSPNHDARDCKIGKKSYSQAAYEPEVAQREETTNKRLESLKQDKNKITTEKNQNTLNTPRQKGNEEAVSEKNSMAKGEESDEDPIEGERWEVVERKKKKSNKDKENNSMESDRSSRGRSVNRKKDNTPPKKTSMKKVFKPNLKSCRIRTVTKNVNPTKLQQHLQNGTSNWPWVDPPSQRNDFEEEAADLVEPPNLDAATTDDEENWRDEMEDASVTLEDQTLKFRKNTLVPTEKAKQKKYIQGKATRKGIDSNLFIDNGETPMETTSQESSEVP